MCPSSQVSPSYNGWIYKTTTSWMFRPLAELNQLRLLGLAGNFISDISSLTALKDLKVLDLRDNRLDDDAINKHILTMEANGTEVHYGYR